MLVLSIPDQRVGQAQGGSPEELVCRAKPHTEYRIVVMLGQGDDLIAMLIYDSQYRSD